MARLVSPDSVSTKVGSLKIGETVRLKNPYTSVAVMVSFLKKKQEHQDKIFKIKVINNITTVTRRL